MVAQHLDPVAQLQRIQVEAESGRPDKHVKIRVENYDEFLGWYTSGSLRVGLHQLPLLEEAIQAMRFCASSEGSLEEKIIPFPGRLPEASGQGR